jgi:hypothetical protein
MLIPTFQIDIFTTAKKRDFTSALDRALYLRDVAIDRIITFNAVKDFKHTQSFNDTTQTATFIVPRSLLYTLKNAVGNDVLTDKPVDTEYIVNVGDIVVVYNSLAQSSEGYENGVREELFRGYVKSITPKDNIVIECEDEMWLLKQQKTTVTYPQITVTDLVKSLTDGIIDPGNIKGGYLGEDANAQITISGYRLKANPTVAQALHGLRKHFGIRAWFRTNPDTKVAELWVGRLWYENLEKLQNPHVFKYQANIVGSKLKYQKKENYLKGVRAVSVSSEDNSRKEVFAGDQFGDQTTLHFFDVDDATLKELAENELKRISYTGFFGNFTTVIRPSVQHGDFVKIIDPRFAEEREGTYVVEKVVTTYGMKGAWQIIHLNSKIV